MTRRNPNATAIVLVPLKRLQESKRRLRESRVSDVDALVRALARGVIEAAAPLECCVVTEDEVTGDFARSLGADVLLSPASSLNDSVQWAYAQLGQRSDFVIVAHGDLAEPGGLSDWEMKDAVTLVADHRGDGTTVIVLPTRTPFRFAYGPGSLERHRLEARRIGMSCRVIIGSTLARDVDVIEDLTEQHLRGSEDPLNAFRSI